MMSLLIRTKQGRQNASQKTHFQNAARATVHWLNHHLPAPLHPCVWTLIIWSFFIKDSAGSSAPKSMSMVKLSPIALNFGFDFVLLVHFFWDTLYVQSYGEGRGGKCSSKQGASPKTKATEPGDLAQHQHQAFSPV